MLQTLTHWASAYAGYAVRAAVPVLILAIRGTLVLLMAVLANLCLRRAAASIRHMAWLVAIACLLLLPLLFLVKPRVAVAVLPAKPTPQAITSVGSDTLLTPRYRPELEADQHATAPQTLSSEQDNQTHTQVLSTNFAAVRRADWRLWLFGAWLAGAIVLILRFLVSLVVATRFARRSTVIQDGPLLTVARDLSRRLGALPPVTLRASHAPVPMTLGLVSPTILLPEHAASWPAERLEAALLHELAHVKRRDWAAQALAAVACALYWYNPLAWLAARRLRAESEMACDDCVLASGASPADYAGQLLAIARDLAGRRIGVPTAVAAVSRSQIENRLRAILDQGRQRGSVSAKRSLLALTLALLILISMGLLRLTARAAHPSHSKLQTQAPAQRPISKTFQMKGSSPMLAPSKPALAKAAAGLMLASLALAPSPPAQAQTGPLPAPPAVPAPSVAPPAVPAPNAQPAPTTMSFPGGVVSFPKGANITIGAQNKNITFSPPSMAFSSAPVVGQMAGNPGPTNAGAPGLPTEAVSIDDNNVDIRTALDKLFTNAGVNYTIDPDVTGSVTAHMVNVPFDVALRAVLRSADLTYSVQDSVYQIRVRHDPTFSVETYDAQLPQERVSLDIVDKPAKVALDALFSNAGAGYVLAVPKDIETAKRPGCLINLHLHNVSFGAALRAIVTSTGLPITYEVRDNGVVYIVPQRDVKAN